jgi:DNA-binding NarL/FixJ family response regulator
VRRVIHSGLGETQLLRRNKSRGRTRPLVCHALSVGCTRATSARDARLLWLGPAPEPSVNRTPTRLAHLAETGCGVPSQHSRIGLTPSSLSDYTIRLMPAMHSTLPIGRPWHCSIVPRNTESASVAKEGCETMRERGKTDFRGTVLIADDHEVFRIGLMHLLRRSLRVKRFLQAECFAQVVEHLKDQDVTLTILDLRMPGLEGPEQIARVRLLRPDAQIVVLSASDSRQDILEALSAGAHGYIVKSQNTDQLVDRLRQVLSGEIYVPAVLADLPAEPNLAPNRDPRSTQKTLSRRQLQVLRRLVEGKSNKEIARALNVAEGTVKIHLAALFRVLGATNRAHAAAIGKQLID